MSDPVAVWTKLNELEQAHAELAAKVEQMISKACQDCAVCEGRGWSINVPSQSMYPCRWCGGSGKRSTIEIASLESPAPAPDPVCAICGGAGKRYTNGYCESCNGSGLITERVACANSDCGHTEDLHTHPAFGLGFCLRCPCPDYVPTAEPAPLDPVLLDQSELSLLQALIRKALMGQRNDSTRFRLNAINAKLIAYGRDGAR